MYDAIEDPYCYPGTTVLKNVPGITDQAALSAFEAVATAQRAEEPLPEGSLDAAHYAAIHRHLFQDVYPWAGEFRTVRINKDDSSFCYPEHIPAMLEELFTDFEEIDFFQGLSLERFASGSAKFLSDLNAIHPFREGNGRAQNVFLYLAASQAGHSFDFANLEAEAFLEAMVRSFHGDTAALEGHILKLIQYRPAS